MTEKNIRWLRDQLGLTQSEMAHALSVETGISINRTTVTGWENGHSRPRVDVAWGMVRLARAVNVRFELEHALPENGQG